MKNKSNNAAYALLKRRPIAVNPALIKLTGSHTAAMFLSQAIYWEETMGREYYKTNEDWQKELYMSEQVFTTARKKASKYISVVKKGLPARNFYKIDWDALLEALDTLGIGVSSQLGNSHHQSPQKVGSLDDIESGVTITETTTETTTKTNNIAKAIGETPVEYGNPEINEMFDYWHKVIGYSIQSKRQANRNACSNMIKKHGINGVKELIDGLSLAQNERFAPNIADFCSLQSKMNELILWAKKKGTTNATARF
jgi:hypothetical protein